MTKYKELTVAHIRHFKAGYVLLTLTYDNDMEIPEPGQFFMIKPQYTLIARPISVYNFFKLFKKRYVEFLFKVIGKGTRELSNLKKGDIVPVWGPIGNAFPIKDDKKIAILIAGGRGIAPLFYLATKLFEKKYDIYFFYGVKDSEEFIHLLRIKNLSKRLFISSEDGKKGKRGFITDLFNDAINTYLSEFKENLLFDIREKQRPVCYVCGPDIMIEKVCDISLDKKIDTFISLESHLACGNGVCLGCSVETKSGKIYHICKEGPIFDAREFFCK